jgi:tetratricopeptide (TPR) repeat protein
MSTTLSLTPYKIIVFGLLSSLLLTSPALYADYAIDKLIADTDDKINTWHMFYWLSLISMLLVGLLGLVIPLLQSIDQNKFKIHTICLGTLISACTFLTNSFLKGDYRQYDRIESVALVKQAELLNLVDVYKVSPDEDSKKILWDQIKSLFSDIASLEDTLTVSKANALAQNSGEIMLIKSAYATTTEPSWVKSIPQDDNYLYFVGFADSGKLKGLEDDAQNNAMESAKAYMFEQFGNNSNKKINPDKLAKFLADYTETFSSYIKIDAKKKVYRYYSLIRISKNALKSGVTLFGIEHNVSIPEQLIQTIDASQRERDDYAAKQTKLYEQQEDQARQQISDANYLNYLQARELRREEKKYAEAADMLKNILNESPGFYLGWYNLALAYDALNEIEKAKEAYLKTIQLEPNLPARDATIYNSYGHFLYKQQRYAEALIQFETSLTYDPNNPLAKNNLIQTKSKLK